MTKYLIEANYTHTGVQGLIQEGGSSRRKALSETVEGAGGTVEAIYYAFGGADLLMIVDLPDNETAVAVSMTLNAGGGIKVSMRVLMTPEEIDGAVAKSVPYRAPGA